MSFGQKLKEQRTTHKLSQEQLAEELHIARQSISKWERGEGYPSIGMLLQISKRFDVTLDELLADDEHLQENIVKDGAKSRHPYLKQFFDWMIVTGLVLIVARIIVFIPVSQGWVDWNTAPISGLLPSLIPFAMMVIGAIGSDVLTEKTGK